MNQEQTKIGTRVRLLDMLSGLPRGTEGVIERDYGRRIVVRWELGTSTLARRDEFNKERELAGLEVVD